MFFLLFRLTPEQWRRQRALRRQQRQQEQQQLQQQQGGAEHHQQQQQSYSQPQLLDAGSPPPPQQQQHGEPQPAAPGGIQLQRSAPPCREGVAVLKVGASRLAMQAEQFANELTRHLGIAAPDCRIVRQVGLRRGGTRQQRPGREKEAAAC